MEKVNFDGLTDHELYIFEGVREAVLANNSLQDFLGEVILYDEDTGNSYSDALYDMIDVIAKHHFDEMVITEDAE
jgi:hypothetical protein